MERGARYLSRQGPRGDVGRISRARRRSQRARRGRLDRWTWPWLFQSVDRQRKKLEHGHAADAREPDDRKSFGNGTARWPRDGRVAGRPRRETGRESPPAFFA